MKSKKSRRSREVQWSPSTKTVSLCLLRVSASAPLPSCRSRATSTVFLPTNESVAVDEGNMGTYWMWLKGMHRAVPSFSSLSRDLLRANGKGRERVCVREKEKDVRKFGWVADAGERN